MNKLSHTQFIKSNSAKLGFHYCGVAKAVKLDDDARKLESWLQQGFHGTMHYMENYFDLRIDPCKLVPGARSVITLLLNYFPSQQQQIHAPKISKYAYGKDYHDVIRDKLNNLLYLIKQNIGDVNGRGFVDSAPVLERSWAVRSGAGWIGRNGNLITKHQGSYFFIATLITDLDLIADDAFAKDYCGTCTKCIDACPTNAILDNKVIDASRCISYFTIELKDAMIDAGMQNKFQNWMFGCDVCQDVCPWNRFSKPTNEIAFKPIPEILNLSTEEWQHLSEEAFRKIFKTSPLKRAKHKGIQRNLKFLALVPSPQVERDALLPEIIT